MTTVKLTQTQINEAINALEEASRVLNNINDATIIKPEDISNLNEEVQSAWATLSKAQHEQTFAV